MAMYIVTGCYTSAAMGALVKEPSDREAAVRPLLEAAGGKLISFLVTTGETDFSAVAEFDEIEDLMAALITVGATGTVSNLKTVQAFTSAQFVEAQRKAGALAASFKPAA